MLILHKSITNHSEWPFRMLSKESNCSHERKNDIGTGTSFDFALKSWTLGLRKINIETDSQWSNTERRERKKSVEIKSTLIADSRSKQQSDRKMNWYERIRNDWRRPRQFISGTRRQQKNIDRKRSLSIEWRVRRKKKLK